MSLEGVKWEQWNILICILPNIYHIVKVDVGSILGPIFFLIYKNDLPKLAPTGTKILLYADDTSIIGTSPNLKNYKNKLTKYIGILIIGSN
jgi:hypothetical protein